MSNDADCGERKGETSIEQANDMCMSFKSNGIEQSLTLSAQVPARTWPRLRVSDISGMVPAPKDSKQRFAPPFARVRSALVTMNPRQTDGY